MRMYLAVLLSFCAGLTARAESADAVRNEIQTAYGRALDAMRQAKTIEDLDEINRSFDTQDWQSIAPGQQPRGWAELRKYGFEGLWAPFQSIELLIDTFEWRGDIAVLTGRLRTLGV
jgi:hypothetical protein